jgi:hypothetical protein
MILRWLIYYADGSTFSSEGGTPAEAPRDFVQVIMQDDPFRQQRDIISGAGTVYQYFCWHGDRWIIHDDSGLRQYNQLFGDKAIVLNGFYIEDDKFWEIHGRAVDHPDWQGMQTRLVRASKWAPTDERAIPGSVDVISIDDVPQEGREAMSFKDIYPAQ